jgi:hypothetical protein
MKVDGPARMRGGDGSGWFGETKVDFGPWQKNENEISF